MYFVGYTIFNHWFRRRMSKIGISVLIGFRSREWDNREKLRGSFLYNTGKEKKKWYVAEPRKRCAVFHAVTCKENMEQFFRFQKKKNIVIIITDINIITFIKDMIMDQYLLSRRQKYRTSNNIWDIIVYIYATTHSP